MDKPYEKYKGQYISKQDILKLLWEQQKFSNVKDSRGRAKAMMTIMDFPVADVKTVKHGEWAKRRVQNRYECSCCHSPATITIAFTEYLSDFCPSCGAKMDGGIPDEPIHDKK